MERQAVVDAQVAGAQLHRHHLSLRHVLRIVAHLDGAERAQAAAYPKDVAAVEDAQAAGEQRAIGQRQPRRDALLDEAGVVWSWCHSTRAALCGSLISAVSCRSCTRGQSSNAATRRATSASRTDRKSVV